MSGKIVTYRTEHFEFRVPIDDWNKTGQQIHDGVNHICSIAPSDLTAILLKKFYYDWNYETDGVIKYEPVLVYSEEWVGKEIRHFPYCKELLEFNEWLERQYHWFIPFFWYPITEGLAIGIMREKEITRHEVTSDQLLTELQETYKLAFSGYIVRSKLENVGKYGVYWSRFNTQIGNTYCLDLSSIGAKPEHCSDCYYALSVRCIR